MYHIHLISLPFQRQTKHVKFIRDLVREVTGFAPYERRIMELLRISKDKRALKFTKKRVRLQMQLIFYRCFLLFFYYIGLQQISLESLGTRSRNFVLIFWASFWHGGRPALMFHCYKLMDLCRHSQNLGEIGTLVDSGCI